MDEYVHNSHIPYLAHHGIIGQKWGVTNGPPYPLGENVCAMLGDAAASGDYKTLTNALKAASKDPNSGYTKQDYKADKKAIKDVKNSSNPEATAYTYNTQSMIRNEREKMKNMSDEEIFDKARAAQDDVNTAKMQKMYTDALAEKYSVVMETKYNTSVDQRNNYGLDTGIKTKDDYHKETVSGNIKDSVTDKKATSDKIVKAGYAVAAAAATLTVAIVYNKCVHGQSAKDTAVNQLDKTLGKGLSSSKSSSSNSNSYTFKPNGDVTKTTGNSNDYEYRTGWGK